MIIHTDYKEVRILAQDIAKLCQTMLEDAEDMEQALNDLKGSFLDDGIAHVDRCLFDILNKIADSQTDMISLVKLLFAHADALEASK